MLREKGKGAPAEMVRNIIPAGVECIFVGTAGRFICREILFELF